MCRASGQFSIPFAGQLLNILISSLIDKIVGFQCVVLNVKSHIVYFFLLGKFYCKPHFTHCKISNKHRKRRATLQVQGKVCMGYVTNARNTEAALSGAGYNTCIVWFSNETRSSSVK